jgi:hypothetical protein
VAAQVLVNNKNAFTVQVTNAASNATYFVKVEAASQADHNVGSYALGVDFRTDSTALDTAASGMLSSTVREAFKRLNNYESQLFHFSLPASRANVQTAIRLTIYDSNNQVVKSMTSVNGEALSTTVFLQSGIYTIRLEGGAVDNQPPPQIFYDLHCLRISDPIDPPPIDPTDPPPASAPTYIFDTVPVATEAAVKEVDPWSSPI